MAETTLTDTSASRPVVERTHRTEHWRWAGGLGLAHLLLMLGAFSLEGVASVAHGTAFTKVLDVYGSVDTTRLELASYVEAMSFLVLVPALVLFSRLVGGHTETRRVAAQSLLAFGIAYVGATLAVGFPPLTAAVHGAHHGAAADVVGVVNDIRNYGFMLQVALLMAVTLALGIAAVAGRVLPKWLAWAGVVLGGLGILVTPVANNLVSLVWMVWWVSLCVFCLKGGPKDA